MRPADFYISNHHKWALGIIAALLFQVAAFGFFLGSLRAEVRSLANQVQGMRQALDAHMNGR